MSSALKVSIAANVMLAVATGVLWWRAQAPEPSVVSPMVQTKRLKDEAIEGWARNGTVQRGANGPKLNPDAVAQLEQVGFSRAVVVSALLEDFHRRWDQRTAEMEKRYAPRQVPEREYVELARQREVERVRELKAALGEEGYRAWDQERTLHAVNPSGLPLTPDEAERAYRLQKEFEQQHRELQMAVEDGVADGADAATLQARAQTALEQELERLFGKQRLDRMRGITDPIADVQWKFADLNPTPAQAHAVVAADENYRTREAELANRLARQPADAASLTAELKALNEAREEELRRIFGEQGYEAAVREGDPTFKTLQQFAGAWGLKEDDVRLVHDALRAMQQEVERTRSAAALRQAAGQRVDWREVDAAIEQARQQGEAGLQDLIGGERAGRLKQNGLLSVR